MAQSTEGQIPIPCLHALALGLFERSRILLGQCEFIVDNTLGERPHREEVSSPSSLFDCLSQAMCALDQVHEDYEAIARHVRPSEQLLKEETRLRNQVMDPQPGECIPVGGKLERRP